jgi:hypothetical protein
MAKGLAEQGQVCNDERFAQDPPLGVADRQKQALQAQDQRRRKHRPPQERCQREEGEEPETAGEGRPREERPHRLATATGDAGDTQPQRSARRARRRDDALVREFRYYRLTLPWLQAATATTEQ